MAKNKKTRKGAPGSRKRAGQRVARAKVAPPAPDGRAETVTMNSIFGEIEVPASLASITARETPLPSDDDFTLLDLTDCEAEIDFMSPAFVTRAFAEAEGLDPRVAKQLVRSFSMLMPAVTIRGERARLLAVAPTVRLIRQVELFSGDTHAVLMGMVYGLPRVVLAEFENGSVAQAAGEALVRAFESWEGRLLLLLDASNEVPGQHYEVGHLFTAHEVALNRPVLWHRGERPVR